MANRSVPAAWHAILQRSGLRRGGTSSLLVHLLVIAAFGVLVPYLRGIDFFDPIVIMSYSAIALLMAASAVTMLVAEDPLSAVTAALASALHGFTFLVILYAAGLATVNFVFRAPRFLHPNWKMLGAAVLFGLAGALFIAAFGAMLAVVFSPAAARNVVRFGFLLTLLAWLFLPPRLPIEARVAFESQLTTAGLTRAGFIAAAVCTVLGAGLLYALRPQRTPTPTT